MRILYADDDESSRLLVRTCFEQSHCLLYICENGRSAVDKFQSGSYDLMLMNMQMPVRDGFAASRAIRSWEAARGLKARSKNTTENSAIDPASASGDSRE